MKKNIILVGLIIILITNSCALTAFYKPKKTASSFFVTFFVDNGINQYFIKPIDFKTKKESLKIDFTFRDTCKNETLIIANYSIFSSKLIKNIDSAFFKVNNQKIYFKETEKLFIENKKKYQIRLSNKITYKELLDIFNNDSQIYIYYSNNELIFVPTSKTKKIKAKAKKIIFENIELNRKS